MEKTTIIGNIGKDASVSNTNGRNAVNFTVAVNKSYKDKDNNKMTVTNWYSCTRWFNANESTDVVKYLLKGTQVYVEGNLQPTMYKNKDNQAAIDLKLNVKNIQLLGKKEDKPTAENTTTDPAPGANEFPDNDVPF